MDDEAWVLSPRDQRLHRLNPTAAHLWAELDREPSLEELARSLCRSFEVAPDAASRDVEQFVVALQGLGLVELLGVP